MPLHPDWKKWCYFLVGIIIGASISGALFWATQTPTGKAFFEKEKPELEDTDFAFGVDGFLVRTAEGNFECPGICASQPYLHDCDTKCNIAGNCIIDGGIACPQDYREISIVMNLGR